jgi:hypothetical protein
MKNSVDSPEERAARAASWGLLVGVCAGLGYGLLFGGIFGAVIFAFTGGLGARVGGAVAGVLAANRKVAHPTTACGIIAGAIGGFAATVFIIGLAHT